MGRTRCKLGKNAAPLTALAIALAITSAPLSAQTTGTVTGVVIDDADAAPLVGAEIAVLGLDRAVISAEDGRFLLAGVPTGRYTLKVDLLAYRQLRVEGVDVRGGRTTSLELRLEAAAIELAPIVVEAARVPLIEPDVSESHYLRPARELRALPVDEVDEVVELTPGVSGGHFRGGRVGQESYAIDGLVIKNQFEASSQGLGLELSRYALEAIDVVTGGFGAEYGSALSGVVRYETRKGDPLRWKSRASAQSDRWAPQDVTTGFGELSASAGGPLGFLGEGTTLFTDLLFQGRIDAGPRTRGLTCLGIDDVEPELAAEIESLAGDPATAHLNCPYTRDLIPNQAGDKFIGFARLDRPLSSRSTLTASFLHNRTQSQLYTPEFKYNTDYQLGQRLKGTLASLGFDWSRDANTSALHLSARAAFVRIDRQLGALDLAAQADRFEIAGFGPADLEFLGEDFVRQPLEEQIRSGLPVPGYRPPGGSLGTPFGPAAEGIFFTDGTPGIAAWTRSDMLGLDLAGELLSVRGHAVRAGGSGRFYKVESYERPFSYLSTSTLNFARFYPTNLSGFAEVKFLGSELFAATAGVRVESFNSGLGSRADRGDFLLPTVDSETQVAVTPRIGFAGAFRNSAGRSSFHFNFGRLAQPPDFRFFLDATIGDSLRTDILLQGNPNLSFEEGRAVELGVSHVFGDVLGVSVTVFHKDLTNLVASSLSLGTAGPGQFSTSDRGTVKGVEIAARARWTALEIGGGYSLQEATGRASGAFDTDVDTTAQVSEFPLAFDRRHSADIVALAGRATGWEGTGWGGSLAASYRSGLPLDRLAEEPTRLPSTLNVRLRATRELGIPSCGGCSSRIVGEVRNLLGRDNVIALRRDTGGLGPPASVVLDAPNDIPDGMSPIPLESPDYGASIDLDRNGLITVDEMRTARKAAVIDRNDPSLFFGEPFQIRLGVEVEF